MIAPATTDIPNRVLYRWRYQFYFYFFCLPCTRGCRRDKLSSAHIPLRFVGFFKICGTFRASSRSRRILTHAAVPHKAHIVHAITVCSVDPGVHYVLVFFRWFAGRDSSSCSILFQLRFCPEVGRTDPPSVAPYHVCVHQTMFLSCALSWELPTKGCVHGLVCTGDITSFSTHTYMCRSGLARVGTMRASCLDWCSWVRFCFASPTQDVQWERWARLIDPLPVFDQLFFCPAWHLMRNLIVWGPSVW